MVVITYEMLNLEPHPTAGDIVITMSRRTGKATGTRYLIHASRRIYPRVAIGFEMTDRIRFRLTVERDAATPGRFIFPMYWAQR